VDAAIFHLDGPEAARHLDDLLDIRKLKAIQWEPGAAARPMTRWIGLVKRIQEAGKAVHVACSEAEVPALLEALDPRGLIIRTQCKSEDTVAHFRKLGERGARDAA
jgi:hypothetical protein